MIELLRTGHRARPLSSRSLGREAEPKPISDFELNTVIVSILIAFALTEILSSWGRLVEARSRIVRPSLYAAASGWIFLSLIIHWLGVSAYRDLEFDRNYQSLLFFLPSIFGAASAYVLTPTVPGEGEFDLNEHYFSVAPWAFRLAAAYTALAGVSDLLVPAGGTTPPLVVLTLTSVLLLLSVTNRPRIHWGALFVLGAMLALNLAVANR